MNDKKEEKIIRYGILIVIVLVGIMAILIISMIDFSQPQSEEPETIAQGTTQKSENTVKKRIVVEDKPENTMDTETSLQNPLDLLNASSERSLKFSSIDISEDEIIMYDIKENNGYDSKTTIHFNENNTLDSFVIELYCDSVAEKDAILKSLFNEPIYNYVTPQEKSLLVNIPLTDAMRTLTKEDVERNLENYH